MKAKKNKDLEIELVNDLLAEGEESSIPPQVKSTNTKPAPEQVREGTGPLLDLSPKAPAENLDRTIKLSESKVLPTIPKAAPSEPAVTPTRSSLSLNRTFTRTMVGGDKMAVRHGNNNLGGADAALALSENVRIAQQRIFELEHELERLRTENEQLAAAGETIRKRADELQGDNDFKTKKLTDLKERLDSEREILESSLKAKDREVKELQLKNQEFEMRLSTNLQKIRVRERELENRLELVKMESTAIVRSKDELILDLKRQIDQLSNELENYRTKGQELHRQLGERQEMLRRTVKALRLALSMLEGGTDDQDGGGQKASGA